MVSDSDGKIKFIETLSREGYLIWICKLRLRPKIRLSSVKNRRIAQCLSAYAVIDISLLKVRFKFFYEIAPGGFIVFDYK